MDFPDSMVRILVTANRFRLAVLLEKGLRLEGWTTDVATTATAVLDALRQTSADLILIDADFFQADTASLVSAIARQQLPVVLLAQDYQISGFDLRAIAAPDDIFIKPFSTQHLIEVLRRKLVAAE